MKTIKFLALMAIAMIISISADAKSKVHYTTGNGYEYKTVYNTDRDGRVKEKIVYYMNSNGAWVPLAAYSVFYGEDTNTVTYAEWNSKTRTFTQKAKQQQFDAKQYPVLFVLPSNI